MCRHPMNVVIAHGRGEAAWLLHEAIRTVVATALT